jgi:hypothetical protein
MEILLPEQTTVDDIVFLPDKVIGQESVKITRQQSGAI